MTAGTWVGWGADERELRANVRLDALPGPPQVQHVQALRCCAFCQSGLDTRARCTTHDQFQALLVASDHDLRYARVDGCILDLDDELRRRHEAAKYAAPDYRIERPRLLERLSGFLTTKGT